LDHDSSIFMLIISIVQVIGIMTIGRGIYGILKSKKISEWPTTEGTMNTCTLKEELNSEGNTKRELIVDYSYSVSGNSFTGNRIGYECTDGAYWKESLAFYKKLSGARTVTVRYNPSNPKESVLAFGISRFSLFLLVLGIIVFLFITGFGFLITFSEKIDHRMIDRIEIRLPKTTGSQIETAR